MWPLQECPACRKPQGMRSLRPRRPDHPHRRCWRATELLCELERFSPMHRMSVKEAGAARSDMCTTHKSDPLFLSMIAGRAAAAMIEKGAADRAKHRFHAYVAQHLKWACCEPCSALSRPTGLPAALRSASSCGTIADRHECVDAKMATRVAPRRKFTKRDRFC